VDVVVDVTGYQFYWQYNFPKYGVTVTDDGTGTEPLVLPVESNVMLYGQSPQVNHAWWVPAFGLKFDVIPGRITRGWIRPTQKGFFKGQCAELCGTLHAYMLIHVKVVEEKEFYEWLREKGATFPPDEIDRVEGILGVDLDEVPAAQAAAPDAAPATT
jgi:cytochrome c oxidase subunit 2